MIKDPVSAAPVAAESVKRQTRSGEFEVALEQVFDLGFRAGVELTEARFAAASRDSLKSSDSAVA